MSWHILQGFCIAFFHDRRLSQPNSPLQPEEHVQEAIFAFRARVLDSSSTGPLYGNMQWTSVYSVTENNHLSTVPRSKT